MNILVRDASFGPLRTAIKAKYFKLIQYKDDN